jgi:hypothetical protein
MDREGGKGMRVSDCLFNIRWALVDIPSYMYMISHGRQDDTTDVVIGQTSQSTGRSHPLETRPEGQLAAEPGTGALPYRSNLCG